LAQAQSGVDRASKPLSVLLGPEDPGFDSSLDTAFPGLRTVNGFEALRPLIAILRCDPTHDVSAYIVEWSISNADGSTKRVSQFLMSESLTGRGILTGQAVVLRANETELVSPFFNLSSSDFSRFASQPMLDIFISAIQRKKLMASIQGAQKVETSLDGVVYSDGLFVGPNTSQLFERLRAEQLAQRDEGRSILQLLSGNASDLQVLSTLSVDAQKGFASTGTDSFSFYRAARGRTAQRLLTVLTGNDGKTGLQNTVQRLAAARVTPMRKSATP